MGAKDETRIVQRFNKLDNVYAYRRRHKQMYNQEGDIIVDGYFINGVNINPIRMLIEEKSTIKNKYLVSNMKYQYHRVKSYALKMVRVPYLVVVFKIDNSKYSYAFVNLFEVDFYNKKIVPDDGFSRISEFVDEIINDAVKYYPKVIEKIKEKYGIWGDMLE